MRLAEGNECKELLVEKNRQLKQADSIIGNQTLQLQNSVDQVTVLQSKDTIITAQRDDAITQAATAKVDLEDKQKELDKEKVKTSRWRKLALWEGAAITAGVAILILLK